LIYIWLKPLLTVIVDIMYYGLQIHIIVHKYMCSAVHVVDCLSS